MYFKHIIWTYVIAYSTYYAFFFINNYCRISLTVDFTINFYSVFGTIVLAIFTTFTAFNICNQFFQFQPPSYMSGVSNTSGLNKSRATALWLMFLLSASSNISLVFFLIREVVSSTISFGTGFTSPNTRAS